MDNLATNENNYNKDDSHDKEIADLRAQIAALQEENLILQEKVKRLTFNMMMSYNIVQIFFYKEIHPAFKRFHNHVVR